jgi:hypothetical protein
MRRTNVLQGIRTMRFEELYGRQQAGRLTQEEMAEVLNVDVRTARRWTRRFEDEGLDGLIDRRIGQISGRRAPVDQVMRVETLDPIYSSLWNQRSPFVPQDVAPFFGCCR